MSFASKTRYTTANAEKRLILGEGKGAADGRAWGSAGATAVQNSQPVLSRLV